jgi:hypothetical protein
MRRAWRALALAVGLWGGLVAVTSAQTYFISPTGLDGNPGTAGSPWGTFPYAISQLGPGATLILLDGTYTRAANCPGCTHGMMNFQNKHGSSAQPITIRAQNERQAWIIDSTGWAGVNLENSSYIDFHGLRISVVESPGSGSEPIFLQSSDHITFRKLLLHDSQGYGNLHMMEGHDCDHVLTEDTEVYNFHRHGLNMSTSTNITFRRIYCNGRFKPWSSNLPAEDGRGDACIATYPGSTTTIENTISENNHHINEINATLTSVDNHFFGNISRNEVQGAWNDARQLDAEHSPQNSLHTNFVVIGAEAAAIRNFGGINLRCDNCTVLNSGEGFTSSLGNPPVTHGQTSMFSTNTLIVGSSSYVYDMSDTTTFQFDYLNSFQNFFGPNPSSPAPTHLSTINPQLGTCMVWIPDSSPMKFAGLGGADIGANILYQYHDGVIDPRHLPLWDPTTGQFAGCGAVVAGVNESGHQYGSCIDVQQRLNINTGRVPYRGRRRECYPDLCLGGRPWGYPQ